MYILEMRDAGNSERKKRVEERWAQSASEAWPFEPFTPLTLALGVGVVSGLFRVSTSCMLFFIFSSRGVTRSRTSLLTRLAFSGIEMSFEVKMRLRSVTADDRPAESSAHVCWIWSGIWAWIDEVELWNVVAAEDWRDADNEVVDACSLRSSHSMLSDNAWMWVWADVIDDVARVVIDWAVSVARWLRLWSAVGIERQIISIRKKGLRL